MEYEPEARRGRPPSGKGPAKNRNIRLTDEEWKAFKYLLGAAWLRKRIASALKRHNRQPTAHTTKE